MNRQLRIVRDDSDQSPIIDRPAELVRALEERINFVPTRERPALEMKKRGVYLSNSFDPNGNPVVYAIRADGRAVAQTLPWLEGDDVDDLIAQMWVLLDRADPPISLPTRVVSFAPVADLAETL